MPGRHTFKLQCGLGLWLFATMGCVGEVGAETTASTPVPEAGASRLEVAAGSQVRAAPPTTPPRRGELGSKDESTETPATPPVLGASLRRTSAVGYAPVEIELERARSFDMEAALHVEGEQGPVTAALLPLGDTQLRGFMVIATRPWPTGTVVVDLGMERATTELAFEVPRPRPVTADPSFEHGEKGVWFGAADDAFTIPAPAEGAAPPMICTRESNVGYTVWSERERFAALAPTEGAWLALCSGGQGHVIQTLLEIPAGAERVTIDAGAVDYDTGLSGGDLSLTLRSGDARVELQTDEPMAVGQEPAFRPFSAPIAADGDGTWLVVEYDSPRFDTGAPSGAVFLDHLRFE